MRHHQGVDTSCPRCGAAAAQGASRCGDCGFVFFEGPARPRVPWRPLAAIAAVAVVAVVSVLLLTRDSPAGPVEAAGAGELLAQQLRDGGMADVRTVRCDGAVRRRFYTRCHASYVGGDTQLLLVVQTADGELDIQNPYPAQRRPGG